MLFWPFKIWFIKLITLPFEHTGTGIPIIIMYKHITDIAIWNKRWHINTSSDKSIQCFLYIHGPSYCQGTCIQLFSDPKVVYQLSLLYRQYYPLFHVNTVSLAYFIKTNFTVT
jgi:hypothetical protein